MSKGLTNGIGGSGDGGVIVGTITPTSQTNYITIPCDFATVDEVANMTISSLKAINVRVTPNCLIAVSSYGGSFQFSTTSSVRIGATVAYLGSYYYGGGASIGIGNREIVYDGGKVTGGYYTYSSYFDTSEYMYTITPAAIFS